MSDFNQNNDDEDIVVTLDLDDGSQVECEILTIFTVGERDYIALLPLDEMARETRKAKYLFIVILKTAKAILPLITLRTMKNTKLYPTVLTNF